MSNDASHVDGSPADTLGRVVHRVLLGGVLAAAALMIGGLLLAIGEHEPRAEPVHELGDLLEHALARDGFAVIDLGLVVLMLTPVVRVVVLAVAWLVRRQWTMAVVALTVAVLLAISMLMGVG